MLYKQFLKYHLNFKNKIILPNIVNIVHRILLKKKMTRGRICFYVNFDIPEQIVLSLLKN